MSAHHAVYTARAAAGADVDVEGAAEPAISAVVSVDAADAPSTTPEVLNLEEAAAFLRVRPNALRVYLQAGEVPGVRMGQLWRLSRTALDAWLAQTRTWDVIASKSPKQRAARQAAEAAEAAEAGQVTDAPGVAARVAEIDTEPGTRES